MAALDPKRLVNVQIDGEWHLFPQRDAFDQGEGPREICSADIAIMKI